MGQLGKPPGPGGSYSGRGSSALSRRGLLKVAGFGAFGVGSAAVLPLFSTPSSVQKPADCRAPDQSSRHRDLVISNWPDYIDPIGKKKSTLRTFEDRTGIDVHYTDDVSDNAEFFAKIRNQLGSCQPIGRDMMMLTDWMAARVIGLGWVQPLDPAKVPNLHKNLLTSLRNRQWDPKRTYSAPWQSGLTGIAYNASKTKEVRSFEELVTRPDLKGRITLLSEMRDTMAFMLRVVGADPDKFTSHEWGNAIERMAKVVKGGQVRAFTGNEYIQDLSAGNILACEAWSGDVASAENEDLVFVPPEEGLMIWADNMLVPNLATHQANAEEWINYYYEPEVAARLAAYVYFICPVKGAEQAMEKVDPEVLSNKAIKNLVFPDAETLAKTHPFMALTEAQIRRYEGDFADVTGG